MVEFNVILLPMSMRRLLQMITFLGVFSVFLFVANYVVYQGIVVVFGFIDPWQLYLVAGFLILFSGGFIVATILGSLRYNWFTRIFYTITAVWRGLFV